jgi:hypothetical protein
MVKVWPPPRGTATGPAGEMDPLAPALAVRVAFWRERVAVTAVLDWRGISRE